jgi:ATP adenylyltransferase
MEHVWSPWRYKYIATAGGEGECIFCGVQEIDDPRANLIIHRASFNFVILNLYPYTSGHLMIVPYQHTGSLSSVSDAVTAEMMSLAKTAQHSLEAEYHPDGFNIGMNLGRSAGAGVADHIHLHVVPRWVGDANFISVIGETRVLPESLETTFDKLKRRFDAAG